MSFHFRKQTSGLIGKKIKELTVPQPGQHYLINRNPRNLEKLRIARKPQGYHLEKPGRSFWHKLHLNISGRYVTAEVQHFQNGTVVNASTSEWAIKQQLFKTKDTSAFINLARVLAFRCLRSGITEMFCNIEAVPDSKTDKFLKTMQENGVQLQEPERYVQPNPWDAERPEKPWEVVEEFVTNSVVVNK